MLPCVRRQASNLFIVLLWVLEEMGLVARERPVFALGEGTSSTPDWAHHGLLADSGGGGGQRVYSVAQMAMTQSIFMQPLLW